MIESVDTVSQAEQLRLMRAVLPLPLLLLLTVPAPPAGLAACLLQDNNGYIDFEEFRRMMKDGPVEFSSEK
jgi:hypothetical protein